MTLPAWLFSDPSRIIEREESKARRAKYGCAGCRYSVTAWGVLVECRRNRRPGPKGYCTEWEEACSG